MHEAGLARQVIDACAAELSARGGCSATSVGVRIGALSGVDPEALRSCFDELKQDTALRSATLRIDCLSPAESYEEAIALEIRYMEFDTGTA